ncbi:MAG: TIM barrel protein [Bacteroidota bacterium]|nr:TIM barrel protein [Bacteroidota bacterium]MDP4216718.1 TIM barrel protein [Bacteroidota bacterium]MDP4247431.1 TIM barrel protein [Bacteroidota bacterium]MDP4256524.1 TIM barrel protein [Bacteroidota bacterium]MDP4259276.1 TIM barrel protein [Bacteroidota bacterium]
MQHTRRDFLKNGALAIAAAGILPEALLAAGSGPSDKERFARRITGIQLYSVRDDMKKDPSGTLKQLAAMGYKYVEHANYVDRKFYGYSAKEFKALLDGLGLKMLSGHTVMRPDHWDAGKNDFTDAWKYTVDDAATVGQRYVISPWLDESLRKTYDDMLRYMDVFNRSGALCKKSGMKFGYHNHDFEFSQVLDNKKVFDIILQHTDPELVAQQLDIGNLYNGGAIAIAVVMQYPDRFELMHVKDEIKATSGNEKYESTILGQGIVNTRQVIDLGKKSGGTHQFIIEQESYQGKTPLDCAREDLGIMKKWGY